jgi:glutamate-1-semialdehyde 2,1-aminomutase
LNALVPKPLKSFYTEVMQRKRDDHLASHSNVTNQFFHLISSSVFIYCYFLSFSDLTPAMCLGLAALFVRQFGHAILEPPCRDKEELLLGFNTPSKTLIVTAYILVPVIHLAKADAWMLEALAAITSTVAQQWFALTLVVMFGRVAYLFRKYNFRISMIWFVKLITDPFTDIAAYSPRYLRAFRVLLPSRVRTRG